ncbi:MAG: hypothetical protein MUF38_09060, partial [Anaerolineae bacterium]|nr:hypothetical protein [Anaerolineae bacterium]
MRWLILAVLAALVSLTPAAQETDGTPRTVYHVLRDNRGGALAFINPVTGDEQRVLASGERFTVVRGGVIWWDSDAGQVMWAGMDTLDASAHPFIQLRPGDSRVDWAVS